jgi:TRAP-type C4-dicarboxylate transport system permease small subunit
MAKNGKSKGSNGKGSAAPGQEAEPASNGKSAEEHASSEVKRAAEAEGGEARSASPAPAEITGPGDPPSEAEGPKGDEKEPPRKGAAWAAPIVAFEAKWTWFESRLITFVLLWQLAALVSWVFLNGLAESVAQTAGVVFRAAVFGIVLGTGTWFGARKMPMERRRALTIVALAVGFGLAPIWKSLAIAGKAPGATGLAASMAALDKSSANYFDNFKGWLQGASTLTLLGGLRGLATRLTLWLALLGGSLATGAGKHIHIDVIYRFLPRRLRIPAAIVNYCAAALVCASGAWGFVDHIAITSYGANKDDSASSKISRSIHEVGDHLFFTRKQIGLDLRSIPHVLKAERYDSWMSGAEWNSWVDDAGLDGRFTADEIKNIKVPEGTGTHLPLVLSPSGETMSGALAHTLGLVFPFGLMAIALRFLLRALMTASGHLSADPNEAHKEELRGGDNEHSVAAGGEGGV